MRTYFLFVFIFIRIALASNIDGKNLTCLTFFGGHHFDMVEGQNIESSIKLIEDYVSGRTTKLPKAWVESMDRIGNSDHPNIIYIHNLTHSTFNNFRNWFRGEAQASFADLLRKQHIEAITANSNDLSDWYTPGGVITENALFSLQPGKMRFDSDYRRVMSLEIIGIEEDPLVVFGYIKAGELSRFENKLKGEPNKIEGIPTTSSTINLGLFRPGETSPHNRVLDKATLYHRYANPKDIPLYLREMESILIHLRGLYKQPRSFTTQAKTVKLIARYHQLFISALPFARVNNSIAMAQVNFLLMEFGLNPIPHGVLDIVCLLVPSEKYQVLFQLAVQKENPKYIIH
jgi:hypothetical protein